MYVYGYLQRKKLKSDDLGMLSYSDGTTHISEVVGISPLPSSPLPLCLTSNGSFSGFGAFHIHQCQAALPWQNYKSSCNVLLSGTLAMLHKKAGLDVLNIEGHDLCDNFGFLVKGHYCGSLKLCSHSWSPPGSVREHCGESSRQWISFDFSSLTVGLLRTVFPTSRRTHLLVIPGVAQVEKEKAGTCSHLTQRAVANGCILLLLEACFPSTSPCLLLRVWLTLLPIHFW